MKIAVINEISTIDKNKDIISALEGMGHEIINTGMSQASNNPELSYIHTGFLSAILLNLKRVDFVIGGCGTGHGYLNSIMQYPGVFCGLILSPLDAWLFSRINGGNCISLSLNKGYGWGGEVNLKLIFDVLFNAKPGSGYPESRREPQAISRKILSTISQKVHYPLCEIISKLEDEVIKPVLKFPGVLEILDIENIEDAKLKEEIHKRIS